MHQIAIDCRPGYPRPSNLLPAVIEGLGLPTPLLVSTAFGQFTWEFAATDAVWESVVPYLEKRLSDLHDQGQIRYARWS